METLDRDGLEDALFLESERMHGSLFDSDEVTSERTVETSLVSRLTSSPVRCSLKKLSERDCSRSNRRVRRSTMTRSPMNASK